MLALAGSAGQREACDSRSVHNAADPAWRHRATAVCPSRQLLIFRARHTADRGIDVGAFGLYLIGIQTAPGDSAVPHARDEDATLVERGAVRLGSGPVDLDEDRVAVRRRSKHVGVEV